MENTFLKLLPIIFTILILPFSFAELGQLNLDVITEDITPSTVEPGGDVTVTLSLINSGEKLIKNVEVSPRIEGPILLKSKDITEIEKDICVGCSKQVTFYLRIKENAISGTYPITFKISAAGKLSIKHTVNIKVIGKPDILFFYNSSNSEVSLENNFVVPLVFKNVGTGKAKNIKISSTAEKFVLAGSNTLLIKEIEPNKEQAVNLNFYLSEETVPDSYFIPLSISYQDEMMNDYSVLQNIGIKVKNIAELGIQKIKFEPAIIKEGEEVLAYIVVENTKKGEAKDTKITFTIDDYTQEAYLGKIKGDEDSQAAFTFIPKKGGKRKAVITLSFRDDEGNHEISKEVVVYVNRKFSFGIVLLVVILLIIFILVFLYFFRQRV